MFAMLILSAVPKVAIQSPTSSHFERNKEMNLYFSLEDGWGS